jgi:outer membrane biosynthesis protein TonB
MKLTLASMIRSSALVSGLFLLVNCSNEPVEPIKIERVQKVKEPAPEEKEAPKEAPAPQPVPELKVPTIPEPKPEPLPEPEPEPEPAPAPEPEPQPLPEPEPEPEREAADTNRVAGADVSAETLLLNPGKGMKTAAELLEEKAASSEERLRTMVIGPSD